MSSYTLTSGTTRDLADSKRFIESLDSLPGICDGLFDDAAELIVTRAPGRLDLMGGIADYSGSLVLQLPIAEAAHVALQLTQERKIRIVSLGSEPRQFSMHLAEFGSGSNPVEYDEARERFQREQNQHWASYVAGAFLVLMRESHVEFDHGAGILISSDVPEGKGVSSSAALEVAVMQAIASAFEIDLTGIELALLCQKVENQIAGAPSGIMDQMTAACGENDQLLELLCQPSDLKGTLEIPDELELWGIDSGVRHSVSGSDYGTVRTAAFMGYRIIAKTAGLQVVSHPSPGKVTILDPKWHGYLANITPQEFEDEYAGLLPASMPGKDFLERYEGTTDDVTLVEPDVVYPVLSATKHPIYEHYRVQTFRALLNNWTGAERAAELGRLMFESHQSYSDCGLGSERTDQLVTLVRAASSEGLYGARITGGGSGGTVAVLGRRGSNAAIQKLVDKFHQATGHLPLVISGSSPGASAFGHLRLAKQSTADSARSL